MSKEQKQKLIIEAAIKRFSHFGVAKTTMQEIALDLSISKPLLYYYFPDKISLYGGVIEYIININTKRIGNALDRHSNPFEAIEVFLELRTEFIVQYYNLLEFLKQFTPATIPDSLRQVFTEMRIKDLNRIIKVIEIGTEGGYFTIYDRKKVAELYFEFLESFRFHFITNRPNIFPSKKDFYLLLKKEKEFSAIFFKGLTTDALR
jgi:TetR/AcrR family transcriptional repressor of mexJK operon